MDLQKQLPAIFRAANIFHSSPSSDHGTAALAVGDAQAQEVDLKAFQALSNFERPGLLANAYFNHGNARG